MSKKIIMILASVLFFATGLSAMEDHKGHSEHSKPKPQMDHHSGHQHHSKMDMDKNRPSPITGKSIYNLDSTWTNQEGKKVNISKFEGKPLILTMAYTNCKYACPVLVSDILSIERELPKSILDKLHIAMFSFDSERDTPQQLKKYYKLRKLDESRWSLLAAPQPEVRELSAVLGVSYKKDSQGEFAHSNVITLLDENGVIQYQQVGLGNKPDEFVKQVKKLMKK